MDSRTLVREAYRRFADFDRPARCTRHDDDCPDCRDHDAALSRLTRDSLSVEDVGIATWSPLPFLNAAAMAHFLPRLIELAVANPADRDGDPFAVRFVNAVLEGPGGRQFRLLGRRERDIVRLALRHVREKHGEIVSRECWGDELDAAIGKWSVS